MPQDEQGVGSMQQRLELVTKHVHVWIGRRVEPQRMRAHVLARYLGVTPGAVTVLRDRYGKPSLGPNAPIHCSFSHSGDQHWVAVSSHPVGVDVQQHRINPPPFLALARRFFAPNEAAALAALEGDALATAFYRLWTRKEAMVKALGRGLAFGLTRLEVSFKPSGMDCLLSLDDSAKLARHWSLGSIPLVEQGYTAAVAVAQPGIMPTVYQWPEDEQTNLPSA